MTLQLMMGFFLGSNHLNKELEESNGKIIL